MKNRFIVIMLVIILSLSLTACGGDASETKATSGNTKETKVEEKSKSKKIDESLTGAELLASVEYKIADSLIMTAERTLYDGSISTSTTYTKGENMRVESTATYGDSVMIYNADEGKTYQYTVGDAEGMVTSDEDEDMDDFSTPTLAEFAEGSTGEVIARVEELDGKKVIYIETFEESEDGDVVVRMWYSAEYSVPLKFEVESEGQIMMTNVVTDIEYNGKIAQNMFEAPSDVTFVDYSMGGMAGVMTDMAEMSEEELEAMFGEMTEEEIAEMLGQ
jgi:outer membrane lipoprotein-sorting protein